MHLPFSENKEYPFELARMAHYRAKPTPGITEWSEVIIPLSTLPSFAWLRLKPKKAQLNEMKLGLTSWQTLPLGSPTPEG